MKLKILERSDGELPEGRRYHGLDRKAPFYVGELSDSHQTNQAFYMYVDKATPRGVLDELDFCKYIVDEYSKLKPPVDFEIIEITTSDEAPNNKGAELLGFEVACVYRISLLTYILHLEADLRIEHPDNVSNQAIETLFRLVHIYFHPKLNSKSLFNDHKTASFYLDCMMALQRIRPNLWEGNDCNFEVIGIWRIT